MSRQEQFATPGQLHVRVENKAGPVRLRTHPGTTTEVEVTTHGLGDEEVLERTRVEHREHDGAHRVLVEVPGKFAYWAGPEVRTYGRRVRVDVLGLNELLRAPFSSGVEVTVTVALPEGATIEVVTAAGEVVATGRYGPATVESASGEVSVDLVDGDLTVRSGSGHVEVGSVSGETKVNTASGDVKCGRLGRSSRVKTASGDVTVEGAAGPLTVQTASGDVTAGELAGDCQFQSASGDQRVERLMAGRARFETVSGDLVVGIARSTAVAVDAETITGDLSSEIELGPDGPGGLEPGPADDRHVEVRARSVSGDVHIVRAPT